MQNSRVVLPRAAKPNLEAEIRVRKDTFAETFERYKQQHCTGEGNQRSNLSHQQRLGLQSLRKRIKDKQVVICKSDKTGKLIPVSPEVYQQMGNVHIGDDREISNWETHVIQKTVNNHTSAWLKLMGAGET